MKSYMKLISKTTAAMYVRDNVQSVRQPLSQNKLSTVQQPSSYTVTE